MPPIATEPTQNDQDRSPEIIDLNTCHARKNAMRRHAHRSMALNSHVFATPHFTYHGSTHEEAGAKGFAHFLRSQLNHSPSVHRPSFYSQQLQLRPRHTEVLFSMPSQRAMQFEMPSESHIKCEEWTNDLSEHHFVPMSMPTQRFLISYPGQEITSAGMNNTFDLMPTSEAPKHCQMDVSRQADVHRQMDIPNVAQDGVMLAGHHMLSASAEELSYNSAAITTHANKWSLPHLFTNFTVQPHDASSTLLRVIETDSPLLDGRTLTQHDVWKYEAVAESQWSNASLSYEDLAASSPDSVDTYSSEIVTPTTSSASSFDRQSFMNNANLTSIAPIGHKSEGPLLIVEPGSYNHLQTGIVDRSESPMFSMEAVEVDSVAEQQSANRPPGMPAVHPPEIAQSSRFQSVQDSRDERHLKDEQLLAWRDENLSYREIKRLGCFKEAESTLRGRYRALTKLRKDRVRKPKWEENDCQLLRSAVRRHYRNGAYGMPKASSKVPWKKVTVWMKAHGSSYDFAPATCAKKWEEIKDM